MYRGGSLFSILLHTAVGAAVLFWPVSPRVRLDQPMMQISLTMGAPGGEGLASAVLGHRGDLTPARPEARPAAAENKATLPTGPEPQPAARPSDVAPAPQPAAAEIPRPEARPEPRPEPPKPAEAEKLPTVSPVKKEPKPQPKRDPQPKPEAEPKQPAPKAETRPAAPKKPARQQSGGRDAVRNALASAQKESGVAGALAELQREAGRAGTGGGAGEGSGPGGGGLDNVYAGLVILAVKPNWKMALYGREQLVALVRVRLDREGNVLDASLEQGSGRADFDSSAVNAVLRTKRLPKPPTPDQQDLILTFNSSELAAGR